MKCYTYWDNSSDGPKVKVFTCYANCISESDKQFTEALGYAPEKKSYIGVTIQKGDNNAG